MNGPGSPLQGLGVCIGGCLFQTAVLKTKHINVSQSGNVTSYGRVAAQKREGSSRYAFDQNPLGLHESAAPPLVVSAGWPCFHKRDIGVGPLNPWCFWKLWVVLPVPPFPVLPNKQTNSVLPSMLSGTNMGTGNQNCNNCKNTSAMQTRPWPWFP